MGVTTRGLPWPAPTAPVASGAADIRALAEAIDPKLGVSELAWAEKTANVTVVLTSEAAPGLVITAPSVTFDGITPVLIEFYAQQLITGAAASASVVLNLWRDNVNQGMIAQYGTPAAGSLIVSAYAVRRLIPPAGPHTYDIRAWANGAAGSIGAGVGGAGTVAPMFIRISRA